MERIWAKRPDKEGKVITLREHVEDILENSNQLLTSGIIRKAIQRAKIKINEEAFVKILRYAIFCHDLGKISPSFQKKLGNEPAYNFNFPYIRHNILSLFFINKEKIKELCEEKEGLYATFLSAVAFHHWKKDEKEYLLYVNDELIKASEYLLKEENGRAMGEILADILRGHFEDFRLNGELCEEVISFDEVLAEHVKERGNLISAGIIPPYSLYFLPERLKLKYSEKIDLSLWILLSGLLMRLDHFASFEENEGKFRAVKIEKEIPKSNVLEKLKEEKGLSENQLWQREIVKKFKDDNLILIAPTGIGKTEFAFAWAEGEKFFYTLPFRVATNQIFERARGYFNEDEEEGNDPDIKGNVSLLHSDADLYLIDKSESSKDDLFDGENLRIVDLARHFSLPINICTGDQIFPSALKYPGYEKVYATLGYSRLIIDEVQAYDPRACAVVVKLIEDIVSFGGKFLLMTATLPGFVRDELNRKGIVYEEFDFYKEKLDKEEKLANLTRHKIKLEDKDIIDAIDEILEKAGNGKREKGKRVLVILNTIEKAEKVYEQIESKFENKSNIWCLHARLTMEKRSNLESQIGQVFKNPKDKNEKEPKILVATQVVEASLDIDADYLFTEICPMDSLIQRMGRVMRRVDLLSGKVKNTDEEFNYDKFYEDGEANVYVFLKHKDEDKEEHLESGKWRVYGRDLLCLTLGKLVGADLSEIKSLNSSRKFKDKIEEYKKQIPQEGKILDLKEKEKNEWVRTVYNNLPEPSTYKQSHLSKFYETIEILNSGYISENKEEAHNLFRKIYTISAIEIEDEGTEHQLLEKINELIKLGENLNWLTFKIEIIAKFVKNIPEWEERELTSLWDFLKGKIKEKIEEKPLIKDKLEKYSRAIWVKEKKEERTVEIL